jgi:signal transduction histidine kinase
LAAIAAMIVLDRLAAHHADRRLSGATDVLAGEIDEESEEGEWEPLGDIVADENAELVTSGVRLAVYSGTHRIAGDGWVPRVVPGACHALGAVGSRVRACARPYRGWTLVAAARHDAETLPGFYLLGALGALLVSAAAGALSSWHLSRWALRPLTELNDALRRIDPARPGQGSLGANADCEEVDLIREALLDLHTRMQALLDQSQRFAANAAHELRTPLTTIRGELELLLEGTLQAPDRAALLRASARARELGELTDRLLVLASPVERARLASEPVALAEILDEAFTALPVAERARVRVQRSTDGLVCAEPALLRSMVDNAIENALKFSADQPIDLVLEDAPRLDGGSASVRLRVQDRGPGVPPEVRERVFEPFYRAQGLVSTGHGLGLSLVGHIARVHRGKAEFIDTPAGACLQIVLPAWNTPDAALDAAGSLLAPVNM